MYQLQNFISQKLKKLFERKFQRVFLQVLRAFGIPQEKISISLVLVVNFSGHRYPLPPIGVGLIYL